MLALRNRVRSFLKAEGGATALEYALLAFATATVLFATMPVLQDSPLWEVFDNLVTGLTDLTNQ